MKKFLILIIFLFSLDFAYAEEVEKYRCIEVKTDLAGKDIQYSIKKENTVEFILKDCIPENLKISIGELKLTYQKSKRLVEDGRIEKNDLFVIECSQPFFEDELNIFKVNPIEFDKYMRQRRIKYNVSKISPIITPEYPLYPTLKQVAERLNLEIPHRTFIIFSGFGGSHEFFCYIDGKLKKPIKDKCTYTFDQVLDIHVKNRNTSSIRDLVEKYLKRFDYEKAERAYRKLMELSGRIAYEGLAGFYLITGQYQKAKEEMLKQLQNSPYDAQLYISLAKIYLYEKEYEKAKSLINKALKLRFEEGEYEAYGILGEIYIAERNYQEAIISFERASSLFKKDCEVKTLLHDFFKGKDIEPLDCEKQLLPYQLKIMYCLTELGDFKEAEKIAEEILSETENIPHVYGHLSFLYAGKGEFDKALEMTDKSISLLKHKGIGANIVKGEIYPVVVSIQRNTPAERAGLKRGDKIINIGDKDLRLFRQEKDIMEMLDEYINSNETVRLKIHRENFTELKDVEVKVQEILKPEASQVLAYKALILRAKGKSEEFEKLIIRAYELNPEDKLTQIVMALLKTERRRHREAIEFIEKASKDANDSLVLLTRPLIYAKAGKMDKAREFYDEIPEDLLKTKNALYRMLLDEVKRLLLDK
ncbi:MAG: tetratricopeptide repeat protein [Thermodesulfovibrio sp.]|nr:tetratricopeptide repeat protein [Thermodesulfovibrio sp.]